jgi:Ca-activated chloride channel family protein
MSFLWPQFIYLLGSIPLIVAVYIWILRRRRPFAVRYSSLALVREAISRQSWLRRHLPFMLFLLALASLMLALTRPVSVVSIPAGQTTIILAIDVSRSMCSTDIAPSRLEAAKAAALSFVQSQKSNTQIGLVAFAGFAELVQPPTDDQEVLETAIESLTVGRRTAIGSGILESLDAIAEIDKDVAPSTTSGSGIEPTPVPKGAYVPDIIVLLTDGVSNAGPLPLDAAQQAVTRGVRVYTIGFGTTAGSSGPLCGLQFQNDPFGGGGGFGFGGGGFRRGIDEDTLKQVADITGGEYYSAESSGELENVFLSLPTYLITKHQTTEISVLFAALGAILAMSAILLSMLWHPLA